MSNYLTHTKTKLIVSTEVLFIAKIVFCAVADHIIGSEHVFSKYSIHDTR